MQGEGLVAFDEWSEVCPLADLLVRSAARHPDRKALVLPEFSLTYADLRDAAVEVARGILGLGIPERSHVGILANNSKELVAAIFGAALANCVAARPSGTEPKIKFYLFGRREPAAGQTFTREELVGIKAEVKASLDRLWVELQADVNRRLA